MDRLADVLYEGQAEKVLDQEYIGALARVLATEDGISVFKVLLSRLNICRHISIDAGETALHNVGIMILQDIFTARPMAGEILINILLNPDGVRFSGAAGKGYKRRKN